MGRYSIMRSSLEVGSQFGIARRQAANILTRTGHFGNATVPRSPSHDASALGQIRPDDALRSPGDDLLDRGGSGRHGQACGAPCVDAADDVSRAQTEVVQGGRGQ